MMTKVQLRAAVARFAADPNRVISLKNFCEIAGLSFDTFNDVFNRKTEAMSVTTQIRVERALEHVREGAVKITKHGHRVSVGYRRKPQVELGRSMGLTMRGGRIALKVGVRNVNDYTQPTFEEELWRS